MNQREFLNILHTAEILKDTIRHCTTSKGRPESVAEHSWRITLMAFLLKEEFPQIDINKVIEMCLIHDLGECFTGDIPSFNKTKIDENKEIELLNNWIASLPNDISNRMNLLYKEMNEEKTTEAKLYKALDKLEAVIQHNESPLSTWTNNEYELNQTYGFDKVTFSNWLIELRKEILNDTKEKIKRKGLFYEKNIRTN